MEPLSRGASCSSCASLFSGEPMTLATSDASGNFTLVDPPSGSAIPVVIQIGKWRTHLTVASVAACTTTQAGSVQLPARMDPSDPIINLPDIAVSTGSADSLECLLIRMGIDGMEFVPGASTAGKVHIFNGGDPTATGGNGMQEVNLMAGAPGSDTGLWSSSQALGANDLVMLSCEGAETYDAVPANLQSYLDMGGGRVLADHFHYSWFTGSTTAAPAYTAPSEWGSNLATWTTGTATAGTSTDAAIVTTLLTGAPFPKRAGAGHLAAGHGRARHRRCSEHRALRQCSSAQRRGHIGQRRLDAVDHRSRHWLHALLLIQHPGRRRGLLVPRAGGIHRYSCRGCLV